MSGRSLQLGVSLTDDRLLLLLPIPIPMLVVGDDGGDIVVL